MTITIEEDDLPPDPILRRREHEILAVLTLSGEQVEVGLLKGTCEDVPYIKTSENPEPVYMNVCETELLIQSLKLAVFEARGEHE
jgi:hypothetical protein